MRSMNIPYLSSLGARRTKHGLGRRATWLMGTLAVLFAVLAVAVPTPRSASADGPSVSITISDPNYETATATITATGVTFDDWTLRVEYETLGEDPYDRYTESKPEFTASDLGSLKFLADYDDDADTLSSTFTLQRLVPDSDYTVLVKLSSSSSSDIYTDTDTFSTKSGCHQEQPGYDRATDPAQERDGSTEVWFGGFNFSKVTRYELVLDVYVSNDTDLIPRNSGRCVYYNYDYHDGAKKVRVPTTGWDSAYVYVKGAGVRAWIKPTPPLIPGTFYDFHVNFDPLGDGAGMGTGTNTLAPALIINVDDIEQTSASVTVTLPSELQDMGERMVHLVYFKTADEYKPNLHDKQVKPPSQTTVDGSTSFDLENLTSGTEHKVKASLMSAFPTYQTASKTFTTKLGEPTELEVASGDRQLEVSWQAPEGDGVGITDYEVEYRKSGEQSWTTSSALFDEDTDTDVTTYKSIISSLDVSTLYDVRVSAVNSVTEGDEDAYNWAEGSGTTLPDVPASLEVTPGIEQLTLSWDEPAETGTVAITGYVVEYKKSSDTSWTSHTTVTAVSGTTAYETTISNLVSSTEYDVRVRADNGVALQDDNAYNWAEGSGTTLPDLPASLEVLSGIKQLTLAWEEPAETGAVVITGYVVEYKKTSDTSWTSHTTVVAVSGTTTYETTISNLVSSTEYDVRIRADNGVALQEDDYYNWTDDSGTTLPDVPANLEVSPGNKKLIVTWEAPAETGSVSITGYVVEYKDNSAQSWTQNNEAVETETSDGTTTYSTTIPRLTNDTLYDVRVRAKNGVVLDDDDDDDDDYNWATGSGTPIPSPSIRTVTVDLNSVTQTEATVTVNINRPNGIEQTIFLQHRTLPNGNWSTPAMPDTTDTGSKNIDLEELTGNTEYEVQAWLRIDADTKVKSEPFTTDPVEPDPPTVTDIEHGDRKLTVTWTKPDDDGSEITGYKIEWTVKDQNTWTSKSVDDPNALEGSTDQVLINGTEYTVQVKAVNSVGDSQPSNSMDDTPSTIPLAPTIQSVTPGDKKLTVVWNKPANSGNQITNYILQWKDNAVAGWDSPLGTTPVGKDVFTETIGSLDNGTTYAIQVRAKNENGEGPWSVEDTGTPRFDPSVDSVNVPDGTITQTTAVAIVSIAHPTGELKKVHLHYRINSSLDAWTTPEPQFTSTTSVEFPRFTGLKSDTEYRVEASFDSNFDSGVQFKLFTTKRPTVLSVEIDENSIEQAGATAIVRIHEPNGESQTVHLRYRPATQTDWSTDESDAGYIPYPTALDAVSIPIADLESDTEYEVEASLESDYSQSATTTFTTEGPSLTGLTISEVMQQSAKAIIDIEAPNGRSLPVFVRYRKVTDPVNELWAYVDTSSTDATADADLLDMDSGTKYEAQASLDRGFPDGEFLTSEPFTTKGPSLTGLNWAAEMTSATISVTIQAPNDNSLTINYRYRPTSQTDWSTTATDAGSDSTPSDANSESAEIDLEDLNSSTQYQIQVSLASNWDSPTLPVLETTFTTTSPDTSIKKVEVSDRTQTTAKVTVTLNNPDTNGNTVHLRLRKVGETSWPSPEDPENSDPDEAEFPLDQLDENTNYEVEVSLDSGFANSTIVPFWTLREPEISSVNAVDPTKTTVKAIVDILYPDGTERTVHLRYQEKAEEGSTQDWPSARREEVPSRTNKAEKTLTPLIAGTTYLLQASFDDEFPDNETEETEFTTEFLPSVSGVIVDPDTITKTTATAIVSIANPDGIERAVYLQFRKNDKTPEDRWSDPPLEEDTDTGSASIPMESLDPGTDYEVQASFDNTFPEDETKTKKTTFTTKFLPSVSNVRVVPNSITKTTATAEVSIANPDDTLQTVHLRYIVYSATPDWDNGGTRVTTTSDTGTATKGLENLLAGTTYILQASLDTNFVEGVESTTFPTDPEPSAGSVSVSNEMETTATATVVIDDSDGSPQTVHLQYRRENAAPTDAWESEEPITITTGSVTFDLDNLNEGTTYDVEAWLASDTNHKVRAEFTTLQSAPETPQNPLPPPPQPPQQNNPPRQRSPQNPTPPPQQLSPEVASVSVTNETQTTADATVEIDNEGTAKNTVNLRYSVAGDDSWTDHTKAEIGSAVEFPLSSLTAGTTYEVEAWLGSDTDNKATATFTTSMAPSISSIGVGSITQTSADATVNIANPGDAQNTVNLRYSVEGEDSWTDHTKAEIGSAVSFPLSSLMAGTTYEVEAWLGSDTDNKATATFTTSMAPSISSIGVGSITQTSADATVNIANPGDAQNTVNLRYSVEGEDSWTDHTKAETGSAVSFPLSSLMAGTTYEVEAWLANDTTMKVTATFTTLEAPNGAPTPSVSSVSVGGITQTTATATVNIANPGDAQNTVNLRYSVEGEDSWTDHTKAETGSAVSFPLSSLMAGTTYEVEAWLGSDTDNKATATFTTTQAAAVTPPSISSVNVRNVTQTSARVVVGLANANAEQRVYLQYKLSSAQWPTTSRNTTHTNGIATFNLSSLTADTGYHTRVSLNSDMSDATTRLFTTLSPPPPPQRSPEVPPPSVSLVTFDNITQTSADATVNIADAGTAQKTVRLHYRIEGTTGWSTPPKSENTSGSSKTFALTSLTAGTTYEVQAWLNTSRPPSGTQIYRFDTLDEVVPVPAISNLKCENIGQTYATAMVEFANAGTEMKEVFLKHSIQGGDEWTMLPFPTITYDDDTSIPLTGLTEGTTYEVVVALSEDFSGMIIEQCTTLAAPSLSGISVGSITQTNAIATVTIADAGSAQNTVHLRYREFGETKWNTAQTKTTTGASAAFNLTGLDPRTTYEVQTSLDIEFSASKYAIFTTLSPDPSVSGVSVGSITQTSATATVTIAYPGIARKTVRLRYRVSGETQWGAVQTKVTSGGSAAIDLTGLSPRTMYEVEASLSGDFAGSKTATFSTLSLDPSVSGVSIGSITQASAAATVTIANPGTAQKIVYLQYRVDGTSEWSDSALTATTDGPNATIYMTGLIADTEYEVRASLASDFALAQHATFTTLRYPSISNVEVTDVTKTTATAEIDIANPDGSSQTVHLRHRTTTPQGEWSSTFTTASTTGDASIDLTGLTVDTEYEVEASLTSDFAVAVSDTFRTLPSDPVVAEIIVNNIRQTTVTAAIDIANANGSTQKVSLRYRTTTPRGNWNGIQTTTSATDSASINLSGLTPGTEYDVQASLDSSFPTARTKYDSFTTLRYPSIASVEVENVGRNGATVSATIADSHGVAQTVYVRHRATGYIAWRPTQQTDSVDDVASIRLRGLSSGTEYIAEASLDNSFPDGGTRSVTFTTKKREDDDDGSSSVGGVVAQAARAVNIPLLGFSPQMLRFTAIEGGDNPSPQTFLVWNRAQGSMSFTLSNQQEWLSQQPTSGVSNGPDDQVTITASVNSSALASGQYVDIISIDVSSSGKSPAQVIVVLDVLPPDYIRQFVSRDEGGVVVLPDGTVKIVVQPLAPPKDVDIELMKVNLQAHGQPPGEQERVVVAIESNTYDPGGDTPEDVAYSPYVELWVQLPQEYAAACDEGKTRVYSVEAETWSLVEHRCETDESDKVWVVAQVERLGAFALVIDDAPVSPTPTPVAAAVAATPTAIPASAPAVAVQRISLPAQPPTPVPTSVPTAVPMPNGKTTVAPAMAPTPTPAAVPAGNEPSAPMMQASAGDGGSGGFGRIILAALGVPMLIGTLIVVYLLYRERRRRDDARFIERSGGDW